MRSIETHALPMTRAVFMHGRSPYKPLPALGMKLFLSANPTDVAKDDPHDHDLGIDFDAVLADESAEQVFHAQGLEGLP